MAAASNRMCINDLNRSMPLQSLRQNPPECFFRDAAPIAAVTFCTLWVYQKGVPFAENSVWTLTESAIFFCNICPTMSREMTRSLLSLYHLNVFSAT
jgi:hypothetical protein